RMYPDTDLPPLRIGAERLSRIRAHVPEPVWERDKWYRSLNIPQDCIVPLSMSPFAPLFFEAVKTWGLRPTTVAVILIQLPKRVARALRRPVSFTLGQMREILEAVKDCKLAREGVLPALRGIAEGKEFRGDDLPPRYSEAEVDSLIVACRNRSEADRTRKPEHTATILIGCVMRNARGRVEGKTVAARVKTLLGKTRP
ncbi:MAG: aspartyl-tRNA(Asn) amidotransferase, subunit, partial [Bacteroidetes bacterium]|nr:aspartyl-tRNA(Asn) amidotransferase, subunit [Bacteroidota bacterium]